MCICKVDKETKKITEGWKIFRTIDNKLTGVIYDFKFKINTWLKDNSNIVIKNAINETYQTGFHFYLDKKYAEYLCNKYLGTSKIYKVKVRNIVATGIEDSYRIGVAREIFIEGE